MIGVAQRTRKDVFWRCHFASAMQNTVQHTKQNSAQVFGNTSEAETGESTAGLYLMMMDILRACEGRCWCCTQ